MKSRLEKKEIKIKNQRKKKHNKKKEKKRNMYVPASL